MELVAKSSVAPSKADGPGPGRTERLIVQNIRTVLVGTDFSASAKQAVARAARIAAARGATLSLLHVIEQDWMLAARSLVGGRDFQAAVEEQCTMQLGALADEVAQLEGGQRPKVMLRTGSPIQELNRASQAADLVVVACGGGNHPLRQATLGSTASRLARLATGPLLAVRTATQGDYRRVLVATDFSEVSVDVMQAAMRLAPDASSELVHCFDIAYEGRLRLAGAADQDLDRYRSQARAAAEREAQALVTRGQMPARTRISIRQGDARFELLEAAQRSGADLIVVGKHGRSFLTDTLLGSVTSWLLAEAPCDVLVVPSPT